MSNVCLVYFSVLASSQQMSQFSFMLFLFFYAPRKVNTKTCFSIFLRALNVIQFLYFLPWFNFLYCFSLENCSLFYSLNWGNEELMGSTEQTDSSLCLWICFTRTTFGIVTSYIMCCLVYHCKQSFFPHIKQLD